MSQNTAQAEVVNPDEHLAVMNQLPTDAEAAKEAEKYRKESIIGYFFPILPREWPRLRLMICMFCLISFTYTFLRIFKDRVVYSVLDNTETKNWLKILSFFVTQYLVTFSQNVSSKSDFNTAFRSLTIYFAIFLGLNTVLVFFSRFLPIWSNDSFTDSIFVSSTMTTRGINLFLPLVLVLANFPFSLSYILSEVVGSLMVSFCFMTYVNNNTTENQGKRFFKVLYFFSNLFSCLSAGCAMGWNAHYKNKSKETVDMFYYIFPAAAIFFYTCILGFKSILEKDLQNKIVLEENVGVKKTNSKKKSMSFVESIQLMFKSKFLLYMSCMSCFYNICANLLETANSSAMSASASYFGQEKSFYSSGFKSFDTFFTHLATSVIVISPISLITEKIGIFYFAAVPLVCSILGGLSQLFFTLMNFQITGLELMFPFEKLSQILFSSVRPSYESYAGTATQSAIKISKYAFYDVVKEAISMRIDPVQRPLFKGVFDGSITKFGKAFGSLYGILMFFFFNSEDNRMYFPITFSIILVLCTIWFFAIRYLTASYNKAKINNTYIDPDFSEEVKLN